MILSKYSHMGNGLRHEARRKTCLHGKPGREILCCARRGKSRAWCCRSPAAILESRHAQRFPRRRREGQFQPPPCREGRPAIVASTATGAITLRAHPHVFVQRRLGTAAVVRDDFGGGETGQTAAFVQRLSACETKKKSGGVEIPRAGR